ncbi:MAG: hypothetical protein A4E65_02311 [Syntrophorhabdus sp. PtaU1.Bin153]|nr:MAG: hypothetical protein A4E65_02311 [Syntrophorhabdus sp. PtaU1.Bin153]
MNMNTILTTVRDAVADDSTVKTWTQATYTADHTVFLGIDSRNPPPHSSYPAVSLYPIQKLSGYGQDTIVHAIGVSVGIHDNTLAAGGKSNVTEYNGMQRIETFRGKVIDAVVMALVGLSLRITRIETEYSAIEFFPFFLATIEIIAEEETEFGSSFLQYSESDAGEGAGNGGYVLLPGSLEDALFLPDSTDALLLPN